MSLHYLSLGCLLLMIFFGAFKIGEREMPYNLVGGANTIRESFLPREVMLLLTVLFTVLFCSCIEGKDKIASFAQRSKVISPLGRMSLSMFLWHQPLFAFYRYFFADELSLSVLIALITVTLIFSFFTYYIIEQWLVICRISLICLILFL